MRRVSIKISGIFTDVIRKDIIIMTEFEKELVIMFTEKIKEMKEEIEDLKVTVKVYQELLGVEDDEEYTY